MKRKRIVRTAEVTNETEETVALRSAKAPVLRLLREGGKKDNGDSPRVKEVIHPSPKVPG